MLTCRQGDSSNRSLTHTQYLSAYFQELSHKLSHWILMTVLPTSSIIILKDLTEVSRLAHREINPSFCSLTLMLSVPHCACSARTFQDIRRKIL